MKTFCVALARRSIPEKSSYRLLAFDVKLNATDRRRIPRKSGKIRPILSSFHVPLKILPPFDSASPAKCYQFFH